MSKRLVSAIGALVVVAASAAIAFSADTAADYTRQVAPAVRALAEGRIADFFQLQPVYGSFSALVRAPLTAITLQLGGGDLLVYRLGALVCLLPLSLVGVCLARRMLDRGQSPLVCIAACSLTVLNPATVAAVENGHPEELLAAALVAGAVFAALRESGVWAGVLLGLALTTKQWAVLAVLPVLLISTRGRRARVAMVAVAITAALAVPLAIASPQRFSSNARSTQGATKITSRFSLWWQLSSARKEVVFVGDEARSVVRHRLSPFLTGIGRPLVLVLSAGLVYLYARQRPRHALEDVFALLALILLLRCIFDPLNNSYYHVPVLLSLLAWEGLRRSGLPVLALLSGAALWATFHQPMLGHAALDNAFYLGWTLSLTAWLALSLYAPTVLQALRTAFEARGRFAPAGRPTIHAPNA